jgi:hypothetical protein
VTQDEDELEPRSRYLDYAAEGRYPPVAPAPATPTPASASGYAPVESPAAPAMSIGSLGDLEARADRPRTAIQDQAPPPVTPRPQWKDYAPAEPTTKWGKFGRAMEEMFTPLPRIAEQRAERNYKNATEEYGAPLGEAEKQSEVDLHGAQTDEARARTKVLNQPPEKTGLTPEETTIHDLMTGENGQPRMNPQTNKPYSYLEAFGAVKQAAQDTKPDPEQTDKTVRIVNGVPHEILIDKKSGKDIRDLGQTKLPGESAGEKRSAAEQVQVEREARAAVHKAEQDYNGARSTVAMQRQLIKDAKSGNKEAVRIVPLEGALEITTSQGVHRINRTEVEQYGQAGNWYDRIVGRIGAGVSGKSIPDDVLNDMDAMTQELEHNAHQRYKLEYDYNKQVVEGYGGKDFDKRVPMVPEEKAGAEEGASSEKENPLVVKAPNGKSYPFKDQASADAFRKAAGIH